MASEAARIADTRAWLARAVDDLRAANLDLGAQTPLLSDALFHCQQLAEKALKGFLTWHDRPFRRTHNLVEVGQECVGIDPGLDPLLRRAAVLSEYASKFRYPGDPDEPSRLEADDALKLASDVYAAILERVPDEARP